MKQLFAAIAVATFLLVAARTAHARGCHEVSDIVGYEKCNRFGDGWALDRRWPIFLGVTIGHPLFDPHGVTFYQQKPRDPAPNTSYDAQFDGSALGVGTLQTTNVDVRFGGYFFGPFYAGAEFGWGFGDNPFAAVTANGRTFAPGGSLNTDSFSLGSLLGVRLPLGRLSLRLEELAGFRAVDINTDVGQDSASFSAIRGLLETRALLDVWATPNVTLSVYGGTNAVDTRENTMGLLIELHGRSFDGAFALW